MSEVCFESFKHLTNETVFASTYLLVLTNEDKQLNDWAVAKWIGHLHPS